MPLTALEQELRDRPLDFLSKYSVFPEGGGMGQERNALPKGGHDELAHVGRYDKGGHQVVLAKLQPSQRASFTLERRTVDSVPAAQRGDYIPIWFLPWESKGIMSMTLHPRPPRPPGSGSAPPRPPRLDLGEPLQADLFFTAGLTGCSIFVEGSARHPTVHHAGYEFDVMADLASAQDVDVAAYWRRVFQDLRRSQGAFSEVNKSAYVTDGTVVQDMRPQLVPGKGGKGTVKMVPTPSKTTRHAVAYSDFLQKENGSRVRIERVLPGGSVFGVRDAQGDWSFYLQRIATVEYWNVEKRLFGRKKLVGVNGGTQSPMRVLTPMEVVRIFPGTGEAVMKPYTNVIGSA